MESTALLTVLAYRYVRGPLASLFGVGLEQGMQQEGSPTGARLGCSPVEGICLPDRGLQFHI